jgi:hypothetical protein
VLFSLGVIGEYLIRIIESSEARPTYFVRRRLGAEPAQAAQVPADARRRRCQPMRPPAQVPADAPAQVPADAPAQVPADAPGTPR